MSIPQSQSERISVIIPVHNGSVTLARCLEAVSASDYADFECIVVDDFSQDDSPDVAKRHGARVVTLQGGPLGPAHARNKGAAVASGEILFFIDADVVIRPDTLTRVMDSFKGRPQIAALFGSYDEDPAGPEFLTQYKNLVHHFVHQQGQEEASTFWSGCGAIRREVFLGIGGFDKDRYPQPSIEDIELGYRLRAAGHKIWLNKEIQVKHLKKWSLESLIKTDVFSRALPWTRLIMEQRDLPNDLNLQKSQRLSALLLGFVLLYMAANIFQPNLILLPLMTGLFLLVVNAWHWSAQGIMFQMSRGVEISSYILIGVLALLAYDARLTLLTFAMATLLLLIWVGRLARPSTASRRKLLFSVMMLALAAGFLFTVVSLPAWLTLPVILALIAIVLLNRQLYLFFAQKRGIIFALAALPLQLFYYFYSVITFGVSGGLHFWHSRLRTK